ncbi:unnamed protein product [Callosobruchus maculatus]|uniref:SWIM-type domain-containing protein n=1 Tax=Callosobruchus maculatus TaxID=64391 RepID=A0A653DE91_CALMS|nr:unnamed protein product [Callosobruchus maculatus]
MVFDKVEDFWSWKEETEKQLKCSYVKATGIKNGKLMYFNCHRSFKHTTPRILSETQIKQCAQSNLKLDVTCPSRILYDQINNKAVLSLPHLGHVNDLKYINLTKLERAEIAARIQQGITFDRILDDIRNNVGAESNLNRIDLLDRQDLRNIKREFSLESHIRLHENDAISVHLWTEKFKNLGGNENKADIYKTLRILLQIQDIDKFVNYLQIFLNDLSVNENTAEFAEYFKKYYVKRVEMWAYCHRKFLDINTNMYLEAMHRTLKYIYFDGKKNKRLDTCINSLMKLLRDITFRKLKRNVKGSSSYRMKLIRQSHIKSSSINIEDILKINDFTWNIKSSTTNEIYVINKVAQACVNSKGEDSNCQLFCSNCKVCVHIFSCTCLDFFIKYNMCKHIHAIAKHSKIRSVNAVQTAIASTSDFIKECFTSKQLEGKHNNEELKTKLNLLNELVTEKYLDSETRKNLNNLFDKSINILTSCTRSEGPQNHVSKEPSNKKIEKQLRLFKTKKRKRDMAMSKCKDASNEENDIKLQQFKRSKRVNSSKEHFKKPDFNATNQFLTKCIVINDHSYYMVK